MTILKLKNPTNIYRIDLKKIRRERGYLALEDLRIKSKFPRSNMPIREVGQSGERKNPRERRKKRKKGRAEKLRVGLKHHLVAIGLGAVLDANNYGVKVGVNNHGAELAVKIYGAKLGVNNHGAELGARIYSAELPAKSSSRLRRA